MIEDLLVLLLAAYGCSSLLVTLLERFIMRPASRDHGPFMHYQLLLCNSENSLEGVVRRLIYSSWLSGTSIHISFIDYGSTDDTLNIKAVFERNHEIFSGGSEPPIMIDLRRAKEQESGT